MATSCWARSGAFESPLCRSLLGCCRPRRARVQTFDNAEAALAVSCLTAVDPDQDAINLAADAALSLSAIEGADRHWPISWSGHDRLFGIWGWQSETIRDHLLIQEIYGVTAESERLRPTFPVKPRQRLYGQLCAVGDWVADSQWLSARCRATSGPAMVRPASSINL